jgi:RNA polymerase sigma-70 factor (ECF subfamily)
VSVKLDEHFFRQEAGRLVAALTRTFGLHNLALAEDAAQDVLCRALEVWKFRGVPDQPRAWLLAAARNRALDVLRQERSHRSFAPDVGYLLESEWTARPALEELLGPAALRDDPLRMMFSCCHPRLSQEAQVGLVLHMLCGFSVEEIAAAFLSTHAATEKRLVRAKKTLVASRRLFELSELESDSAPERQAAVHRALYLLFNEGYHGANLERSTRRELCQEAMRCVELLLENPLTCTPAALSLAALMCFHAARLPGRTDELGQLTSLMEQDRSVWSPELIAQGQFFLERAIRAPGPADPYLFEAAIAGVHTSCARVEDTPWPAIVELYDGLLRVQRSPVVALNRAVAMAQAQGPDAGLRALDAIEDLRALEKYPFYPATRGELELRRGQYAAARSCFQQALKLARNPMERQFLAGRVAECATAEAPRPSSVD